MTEINRKLAGSWSDAIGTIISAIAEIRALAGLDELRHSLVAVGEGLQAVGSLLIGTTRLENPLDFAGNWIDGAGAATSSLAAYLQKLDKEDGDDHIRLEILGDALQSMGASISALANHLDGDKMYALANAIQSLGAGLESIGGTFELKKRTREGQVLSTIGATLQALGSNLNAILVTKESKF